ncbi:MAG TPA: RNase A-like domain-containing protein [Pyrinomonadaceae bacterium]|nr:RNase A-like domain-containing protein [Pyrinomonadaceae bacterium]
MANPVNNGGISAKVSVGNLLDVDVKIGDTAKVPDNRSTEIFQNVNENYAKNPNHARPTTEVAQDAGDNNQQFQSNAKGADAPPAQNQDFANDVPVNNKNNPDIGEDAALLNRPARGENGDLKTSDQGLLNGRGHQKTENQGQTQTGETPPIVILPTEETGNPKIIRTQNTPPIVIFPTSTETTDHQPNMGVRFSIDVNLKAHGNQPYGVIRQVVSQILQQNDIYLSRNTINRLISNQTFQNSTRTYSQSQNLPREVNQLLQNIGSRVLSMLDSSQQNRKLIHQISKEIAHQMRENVQSAKNTFFKNANLNAVHFKHLNISEKMHVAVELLTHHVPPKALENIQNHKAQEVLNGLLLARGLVVPGENSAEIRNLVAFKSTVLPSEVSMTNLRDVGQLVKGLIADTAAAKTTANLDLAVQKFVRILLANNELGVLLATVNLASQAQNQSGLIGRSLALAQIYELINQLIQAGEKAMIEKNTGQKERNIFQTVRLPLVDDFDESKAQLSKLHGMEAAGSLRQFLEFNPALVFDNSASKFNNPDDARQAQKDFINLYHNDIEQWLKSGNHRYVKDFDFDKPVGVVVERSSDGIFTANTARFVLVRDGSVQGWHFLKSFLVK